MTRLRFTLTGEYEANPEHYDDDVFEGCTCPGGDACGGFVCGPKMTAADMARIDQDNLVNVVGNLAEVIEYAEYGTLTLKIEPA